MLDPNREVLPRFHRYDIELRDGQVLSGLIESESENALILVTIDGTRHTVPRQELESLIATGRSLMPEGLEYAIDPRQMGDLLAFLRE